MNPCAAALVNGQKLPRLMQIKMKGLVHQVFRAKHWRGIPMTVSHVKQQQQLRAAIAASTTEEAVA